MLSVHVAAAQEAAVSQMNQKVARAAAKAKQLWPDVIGEVLADEIMALLDLPAWMRSQSRTQKLIDAVLARPE